MPPQGPPAPAPEARSLPAFAVRICEARPGAAGDPETSAPAPRGHRVSGCCLPRGSGLPRGAAAFSAPPVWARPPTPTPGSLPGAPNCPVPGGRGGFPRWGGARERRRRRPRTRLRARGTHDARGTGTDGGGRRADRARSCAGRENARGARGRCSPTARAPPQLGPPAPRRPRAPGGRAGERRDPGLQSLGFAATSAPPPRRGSASRPPGERAASTAGWLEKAPGNLQPGCSGLSPSVRECACA